jgi:undecaprenyl diphosphate synthase
MERRPEHVAIIMDGNGRWASQSQQSRSVGHYAGARVAEDVVQFCLEDHIGRLTLFAFGQDNLARPEDEVSYIFKLFEQKVRDLAERLIERQVQLSVIGDRSVLSHEVQDLITNVEQQTRGGQRLQLTIALNYSGQWHITEVVKHLLVSGLKAEEVTVPLLHQQMLKMVGAPDLLIRTSGEHRLSNFMLWHLAYTELFFTEVLWPDFSRVEWDQALQSFAARDRRFGRVEVVDD